jgi:prepilin-type N-terminal cleavage/methylation domain-containing protein
MHLAQHPLRRGQRGYSLVELLLTLSLLLLFTGLAVVSLDPLNQRSGVTEGAVRFETLLRYARAEAEHSGKRVRLNFVQDTNQFETAAQLITNTVDAASLNHVELTWEPDPIAAPDVFQTLLTIQWGVDQANEMVGVSSVKLIDSTDTQPGADDQSQPVDETLPADAVPGIPPSLTFNPNGSCDSAEITLADRTGKDDHNVTLRIEGFTGSIWRLEPSDKDASDTPDAQPPSDLSAPH